MRQSNTAAVDAGPLLDGQDKDDFDKYEEARSAVTAVAVEAAVALVAALATAAAAASGCGVGDGGGSGAGGSARAWSTGISGAFLVSARTSCTRCSVVGEGGGGVVHKSGG